MHKTLMESIGRREFAPEPHRVTNIASWNIRAGFSWHDAIALNTEAIGAGAFVFLLPVNRETSSRRRLGGNTNTARHCHEAAVALHHVNVLFRERHFPDYLGCIGWFAS